MSDNPRKVTISLREAVDAALILKTYLKSIDGTAAENMLWHQCNEFVCDGILDLSDAKARKHLACNTYIKLYNSIND